jgi:hypothetical protein
MQRGLVYCLTALFGLGLPGCFSQEQPSPAPVAFPDRLLEIARSYEEYGRLDPSVRFAPMDCAAPPAPWTRPRFSASGDATTHGRKLYWVFAKQSNSVAYLPDSGPSPVGQVVVKEAWIAEEVEDSGLADTKVIRKVKVRRGGQLVGEVDGFVPYARQDGRVYHAASRAALFIMYKLDPQTPGTDEGWVYGTVTPDGQQVTSAGRVESCMGCHRDAPHDRLFGLAKE